MLRNLGKRTRQLKSRQRPEADALLNELSHCIIIALWPWCAATEKGPDSGGQ